MAQLYMLLDAKGARLRDGRGAAGKGVAGGRRVSERETVSACGLTSAQASGESSSTEVAYCCRESSHASPPPHGGEEGYRLLEQSLQRLLPLSRVHLLTNDS